MTDGEIFKFVKEKRYELCGSFSKSQLDRKIAAPSKPYSFGYKKIAASIVALLSFKFSYGQSLHKPEAQTVVTPQKDSNNDTITPQDSKTYIITGKISTVLHDSLELEKVEIKIGNMTNSFRPNKTGVYKIILNENQISDYTIISFSHPKLKREVRSIHRLIFPVKIDVELDYPPSGQRTGGAPSFW